jgi:hypothetical protein
MRLVIRRLGLGLGAVLTLSCARRAASQELTDSSANHAATVVEGYLAAYNRHDAPGLRRWLADTVLLGGIPAGPSDERLSPDTLVSRLQRAFRRFPDLRARLLGRVTQAGDVVDRYEITIGKKTHFELFIYRVRAGRITGMWEFRADSAEAAKKG